MQKEMQKENFVMRKKLEDISLYAGFPDHLMGQILIDHQMKRNNVSNNRALCLKCDGTGNECYFVYKECTICEGYGYKNLNI